MEAPIHVVHVDDDADFAEIVAAYLSREDDRIAVHTATSAEEGLDIVAERDVDCIVTDYDLPGYDGLESLERLQERYPEIPVILYTGKGSEEIASEAISAGVTDYLQKKPGTEQYTILANRIVNAVSKARSERELDRTREYFSTILEQASDYVMIVGEDGQVEYISPAVERVMGYAPEELAESDAFEYSHPDDASKAATAFIELFEHPDEENTVEFRARHADGTWRWLEVRGRNLLDDPVIDGVMVNVRDITERKRREHELERKNQRLDEFASVLSHDLRNPLNVAQGRLELARETCDCEHFEPIDRAHRRMESLIDDLLTLAREGTAVTDREPVDLSEMATTSWASVDTEAATIVVETDRTVLADESRLQQVFENLFRNAVEHGGNDVTVTLGELDDGFFVEDDGAGIPAADQPKIFDAGYSTSDEGTGFGLSIVKEIIEAHEWEIRVTEGSHGGARFEITDVDFATD